MRKGKKHAQKLGNYENVFIFPGTIERTVNEGISHLENHQYEKAVESFDTALELDPEADHFLFMFAVALYETRDYKRSKEYAFFTMERGAGDYLSALELYLTNLIQLGEYKEVELQADAIIKSKSLPPDRLNKFTYLRDLNGRLALRYGEEEAADHTPPFSMESFTKKDLFEKQQILATLEGESLERAVPILKEIAESTEFPPSILSFALTLLKEVQYDEQITVQKFGQTVKCIPSKLILPDENEKNELILQYVANRLEKNPSKRQFVEAAIQKFIIVAFPLDWGDYSVEEIGEAYVAYIESLMLDKEIPQTKLLAMIQEVDEAVDF